ncbi:MAG: hypothetical protein COA43_09400 [Robiginitomaculum sp.]|nr:MAG: hypothetical protein COA43_09400 [Robiginitomaculum sp.]
MRNFSTAFQSHIEQECTTLCWAWKLTRMDGHVMGFTDHDRRLEIDGVVYQGGTGFSASDIDTQLGFVLNNSTVLGAINADEITHVDVKAGLYHNAEIEILRVNWNDPTEYGLIWGGTIGDIHIRDGQIEAELTGRSAKLEQSTGRVFSRQCEVAFGGAICGVDISVLPQGISCPHSFKACKDQFQNAHNFAGFPYLIGEDASYAAPLEGDVKDGSSRYSQ